MNSLYWLVTITDRRSTDAFLALYAEFGVTVSLRTVGSGTAVQETLSTLGLEKTEKAVLFAMITADTWPRLQKGLRRKLQIDVPGTGIAFIVPVSSIGGKRALQFLTEHQTFTVEEESTLKDTRYELLLVIANQGHTGSIMDAARAEGAGGGTVIHAKGTGMEGAAHFMGVELVNEKELVLIVSRPEKPDHESHHAQGRPQSRGHRLLPARHRYGGPAASGGRIIILTRRMAPTGCRSSCYCMAGVDFFIFILYHRRKEGSSMNYTHRRPLFWNSLVIVLGNALYALTVALFLEPAGLVTVPPASRWPSGG